MIQGFIYALLAGTLIGVQNVFMARTGEKIGFWETSTLVHGLGFFVGIGILMAVGRSQGSSLKDVNFLYMACCGVGVLVVFAVVQGVTRLGVVFAVPLIIGAQIVCSIVISRFGIFEEKIVVPSLTNLLGVLLLLAGAVLTQLR